MTLLAEVKAEILACIVRGEHEMEAGFPYENPLNDLQRKLIETFCAERGEAWIGNVNLYGEDRHNDRPILRRWNGELVRNFEAHFVVPCYDVQLEHLIRERDRAPYTGVAEDHARITQIYERIRQLGGELLLWN
jgi:hypothetical protein